MTDQADTVAVTDPQIAAKLAGENFAANNQQGSVTGAGSALGSPYSKEYAAEMEKEREASRVRHTRDQRLTVFAEILRARPDMSPEAAADSALAVYGKLGD